jgi:hAT family C-terminal dimerisation region
MHLSGLDGNQNLRSREYHPLLWWNIEGRDKTRRRSKAASLVFSLFPSAAGNERSFKVRSRVHSKTRNRLSDENADKQSYIVYNSAQIRRIDDGEILNCKRDSAVEVALLNGCSEVELENLRALQPSARQSLVLSSQGLSQGNPQSREAAGGELADGLEGSDIDLESVDGLLNSARHSGENDIDVMFADGFEVLK